MCISWAAHGAVLAKPASQLRTFRASCASVGPVLTKPNPEPRIMAISWAVPGQTWFLTASIMCISWAAHGAAVPKPASQPRTFRASCASVGPVLTKPNPEPRIIPSIRCISWAVPGQTWFLTTHHGEHHVHQLGRAWSRGAQTSFSTAYIPSIMCISWASPDQTKP